MKYGRILSTSSQSLVDERMVNLRLRPFTRHVFGENVVGMMEAQPKK
jgi:hypothetical protein